MMDSPKIGNGLPMIGPGADIGISSLHMVGYLGKNYNPSNISSDGYCPACKEKGKIKALKIYRISFQESIFLCEDLQCIYPLGSRSLNNLISPDSEDCRTPNKVHKRKLLETSCTDSPVLTDSKKTRHHIDDGQTLDSRPNRELCDETSPQCSGDNTCQHPDGTAHSLAQNEILEAGSVGMAAEEPAAVDVSASRQTSPQNEGGTSPLEMPLESECVSFGRTLYVQWKNAHALCWLDCILSALVHLEGLKNAVTELCPKEDSVFWHLFTKYNQANKLLYDTQLDGLKGGDYKKLPSERLAQIETCLNEVRNQIFSRLQPLLKCTLGDMESPVFAFPLLLKLEPHIEKLFTYSFSWDFTCAQCGHQYQNRCMKNLVTFTNVIPEWHPLNAAHLGPCNNCNSKLQIRKMVLEKASAIFMVHFVEGLPQNDLQRYVFHLEGCLYQIKSVIQYQANNHFITWILDADGSWLECDDLKGLCCERHEEFEVPASEIHIVIWERKTSQLADQEAARLPLRKPNDENAFGANRSSPAPGPRQAAFPAGTAPVTHPTGGSVAPHTGPPDEAVAPGDHFLPGPKSVAASKVLPSTSEEADQKTVTDFQVKSQTVLLENKPIADKTGIVKTNTLQSQDSLMTSLVPEPCKENQVQDQFVDSGCPSQVVNTNVPLVQLSTRDTVGAKAVDGSHSAALTQAEKSVEVENAQLKQFLPPKSDQSKPERQSNLNTKETATDSKTVIVKPLQNQSVKENQKKPFVGSWVKGLLSRGVSFMPLCVSAYNRDTDLQPPEVARANSVDNFKAKGRKQKAKQGSRKTRKHAGKPPLVPSLLPTAAPPSTAAPAASTAALLPPTRAVPPASLPLSTAVSPPRMAASPGPPPSMAAPPASLPLSTAVLPPSMAAPPGPPPTKAAPPDSLRLSTAVSPPSMAAAPPGPPPSMAAAPASLPPTTAPLPARVAAPPGGLSAASIGLKKCDSTSYGAQFSHSPHGNETFSSAKYGDSVEGQIHKLRLKLLKKLKAKKRKLAALKSSPQNGTLPGGSSEHISQCESPNCCETLDDLLKELQYNIDIADNKLGYSPVLSYNGQTQEEILAEILSPTNTVSTELSDNGDVDFRYLELGDDCMPAPVPSDLNDTSQNTLLQQDHVYCSPNRKNECETQPDLATSDACSKTLSFESPVKTDILDEFFSTSTLNSLASDTLDLPHFDECLFENF
ncbi:SUMO-specific isopeptidase USPL1 isoform X2 [Ochotona princeps]|uniref:SUMO-specific isopeptidase USPL1 isoform X2 n=1 Tax=Ochotona princeps TaxID=9978 RepID=UPI0027151206|nr:SUMO-specific isopeptidase USPL1 isoform X2 [Ochotona princeps]